MKGPSQEITATFTRPNDTTAYAAGDLIANSTTAGSVTLMSWKLQNAMWLRRITIRKSDPDIVLASFRLWLTPDSAITFSNGDNGALSIATSTLAIADAQAFDVIVDQTLTGAGDIGVATFDPGLIAIAPASFANGQGTLYGFLEARAAYTPAAQEVFTISLRGDPYT